MLPSWRNSVAASFVVTIAALCIYPLGDAPLLAQSGGGILRGKNGRPMTEEQRDQPVSAADQPPASPETALKEREIAIKAREVSLTAWFQALSFFSAVLAACLAFLGTALVNSKQAKANRRLEEMKAKENKALERQKLEGNLILTFLADKDATARKENLLFLNRAGYIHLPKDLIEDIDSGKQLVPRVDPNADFGPPEGTAEPGTPLADLNRLKSRSEPPNPDDFDSSVNLERMLNAIGEKELDQTRAGTIQGYVLSVKRGGTTSANMQSWDPAKRDIKIVIAPSMQSGPNKQVRCVITPRVRAKHTSAGDDWSLTALQATLVGKQCKVSGWLLFHFEHFRESANNPKHGSRVWRGTAWELCPVTAIEVIERHHVDGN
jgi:hypothetical protein